MLKHLQRLSEEITPEVRYVANSREGERRRIQELHILVVGNRLSTFEPFKNMGLLTRQVSCFSREPWMMIQDQFTQV